MIKIFKILQSTFFMFCLVFVSPVYAQEKIKIGLLVPMSGEKNKLGQSIIKSTRLALRDIGNDKIEIYPKDTGFGPNKTLQSALELKRLGVKIIIGPVFFENIKYLNEVNDIAVSYTHLTLPTTGSV